MQDRLCSVLRQIGDSAPDPRIGMLVSGFVKHLTRNPIPDEDIRASLEWVKSLVDSVLSDDVEVPELTGEIPSMADDPLKLLEF